MKFNELDLRHSATFLYKLNHLKASPDIISELQILSLFYSDTIYYTSSDDTPLFEVGDVVCGKEIVRSEYDKIGAIYFNEPISEVQGFTDYDITSISIPYGVTSIGNYAFDCCYKLKSVTIPKSVTSLGGGAFNACSSLTSITIPESVTSIGDRAFQYCDGLTSVTIGNGVTSIGNSAFYGCSGLTSITIPESVVSIGQETFLDCDGLTSVVWNAKNCTDFSQSNTPFQPIRSQITSFTFGDSVQHIPAYMCWEMSNLTSVTIGNNVTSIGQFVFYGCDGLTYITIPDSVTSIEWAAFAGCQNLTSITLGNSVTSIESYAFQSCSSLTSIIIPESVTLIGGHAFEGCTFKEEDFINLSSLDAEANNYWGATIIKPVEEYVDLGLPSGTLWATRNVGAETPEQYGDYFAWGETEPKSNYDWSTYKWCNGSLETLTKYCTSSSYGTVDNKTTLDLSDDVAHTNWGGSWRMPTTAEQDELRNNCTWTWTTQNGVNGYEVTSKKNGNSIFLPAAGYRSYTSLTNVVSSCYYWQNVCSASDPAGAFIWYYNQGGVGTGLFDRSYGLSVRPVYDPTLPDTPDVPDTPDTPEQNPCGENAYYSVNDGVLTISGEGIINDCDSDSAPWAREEINEVIIEEGITVLGAHMLRGSNITSVTIPNSVTTINTYAFYGCKNLTEVTIGTGLTRINSSAFNNCSNVQIVNIGSMEQWCTIKFDGGITANPLNSNNAALVINGETISDVVVPNGITVLRNYVFDGNLITSLTLPSSLTEIQSQAIGGCSNCTTITCYAQTPPKMAGKNQISSVTAVYVPAGCAQAYQEASNWANYGNLIVEL